jgi:hypothetical protein
MGPLICGFRPWSVPVATPRFSMSCGIDTGLRGWEGCNHPAFSALHTPRCMSSPTRLVGSLTRPPHERPRPSSVDRPLEKATSLFPPAASDYAEAQGQQKQSHGDRVKRGHEATQPRPEERDGHCFDDQHPCHHWHPLNESSLHPGRKTVGPRLRKPGAWPLECEPIQDRGSQRLHEEPQARKQENPVVTYPHAPEQSAEEEVEVSKVPRAGPSAPESPDDERSHRQCYEPSDYPSHIVVIGLMAMVQYNLVSPDSSLNMPSPPCLRPARTHCLAGRGTYSQNLWTRGLNGHRMASPFERACLAELEPQLRHPVTARLMRDDPVRRELREVRLDGSYPETAIVVKFVDLDSRTVEEWRYPLWEDWFRRPDGTVLSPDAIARDIWVMVIEP